MVQNWQENLNGAFRQIIPPSPCLCKGSDSGDHIRLLTAPPMPLLPLPSQRGSESSDHIRLLTSPPLRPLPLPTNKQDDRVGARVCLPPADYPLRGIQAIKPLAPSYSPYAVQSTILNHDKLWLVRYKLQNGMASPVRIPSYKDLSESPTEAERPASFC
jgi:hypothetical protein